MKEQFRIAVLASTKGTDMQVLIDAIESHKLDAKIVAVISDQPMAYALDRASKHHIPEIYLSPKNKTREEYDAGIMETLADFGGADLIHLIGWMRILSHDFVAANAHKTMNIHPALLPQAPGMMDLDVHKLMIARRAIWTGATVMFIDDGADTGPIIWQEPVMILPDDTPETLKVRVQEMEQKLILMATELFMENRLKIEGDKVKIIGKSRQEVHEAVLKIKLT